MENQLSHRKLQMSERDEEHANERETMKKERKNNFFSGKNKYHEEKASATKKWKQDAKVAVINISLPTKMIYCTKLWIFWNSDFIRWYDVVVMFRSCVTFFTCSFHWIATRKIMKKKICKTFLWCLEILTNFASSTWGESESTGEIPLLSLYLIFWRRNSFFALTFLLLSRNWIATFFRSLHPKRPSFRLKIKTLNS